MGLNDHVDWELHEEIEDLVSEGLLEKGSVAYGVAQQMIHQGPKSLSDKQQAVWDAEIGPRLVKRREQIERQRQAGKDD